MTSFLTTIVPLAAALIAMVSAISAWIAIRDAQRTSSDVHEKLKTVKSSKIIEDAHVSRQFALQDEGDRDLP